MKPSNVRIGTKGFVRIALADRFWSKVERRGSDDCWPWTGSMGRRGYGIIWVKGKLRRATWVAWELHNGAYFPPKSMACHTCDNPSCVNPRHLFVGTMSDNIKDAVRKGRVQTPTQRGPGWQAAKTRCKNGHNFTNENTYVYPDGPRKGARACKACCREHRRRYDATRVRSRSRIAAAALRAREEGKP